MVKNTTGGNKAKGFANKKMSKRDTALRVAREEGEIYAQTVRVMGGNIASAIDINGKLLRAHIRGKFRGRGKRDNFIQPNTWLLVGLHEWGTNDKKKEGDAIDCDVLEVYSESDKIKLKNSVTNIDWNRFILNDSKIVGKEKKDDLIEFANETSIEYEELIASQAQANSCMISSTIVMDNGEEIDVDDI